MKNESSFQFEEQFLLQELILGVATAIGMLLMVANELLGMLLVMLGALSVAGIYIIRIYQTMKERGEAVQCCFAWFNNGAMILAVAGILMLMLMNAFHRPVFYTGLGILCMALMLNGLLLRYNIRGMTHITAQLRLVIALVILIVFFLL